MPGTHTTGNLAMHHRSALPGPTETATLHLLPPLSRSQFAADGGQVAMTVQYVGGMELPNADTVRDPRWPFTGNEEQAAVDLPGAMAERLLRAYAQTQPDDHRYWGDQWVFGYVAGWWKSPHTPLFAHRRRRISDTGGRLATDEMVDPGRLYAVIGGVNATATRTFLSLNDRERGLAMSGKGKMFVADIPNLRRLGRYIVPARNPRKVK